MTDIEALFTREADLRAAARTLERCEVMVECDENRVRVGEARESARRTLRAAAICVRSVVPRSARGRLSDLPTPSLSATVHPPPNRAMGGRVEITFDAEQSSRAEPPPEPRPIDRVHGVTCTLCHRVGHARSNRLHHPPVGA